MNLPVKIALGAAFISVVAGSLLPRELTPEASERPASPLVDRADRAAAEGSRPMAGSVTLEADSAGHYHAEVEIEGRIVPMLVDTGASFVALTAEDAARLGLDPMPSDYRMQLSTANGSTSAAEVRLPEVRIGGIVSRDVSAVVLRPGLLSQSLLGMSFLKTVGHVDFGSRELVLRP